MTTLGLGLAAVGRPAYINVGHADDFPGGRDVEAMRTRTHQLLDAAWATGIRHFDVARSYGLAEQFLGDWLRGHSERRKVLTLGSKWGYTYVGDWRIDVPTHETKEHSLATFDRQWPETLTALGSPPDVYLIHSVTPDSPALHDRDLLGRLGSLAASGVRVGLSTSGPGQADVIGAALALPQPSPFSAVQSTWNILDPSAGEALASAREAGWQVVLKETVANGRLTSRDRVPSCVRQVADRHGTSVDAVAIAAALSQAVDAVLVGPSTLDQLSSNLEALEVILDEQDLAELADAAEPPDDYWSHRSSLPWN